MSICSNEDVEAEFEAELAKLDLASQGPDCKDDVIHLDYADVWQGDGCDEELDGDEDEPESLRLLRAACMRRELALEQLGRDMQAAYLEVTASGAGDGGSTVAPQSVHPTHSELVVEAESLRSGQGGDGGPSAAADGHVELDVEAAAAVQLRAEGISSKEECTDEPEAQCAAAPHAHLAAEREAHLAAEREAQLAAEREAHLAAEREAQLAAEREAQLAAEREAQLAAEREAQLAAEREAQLAAEREAQLAAEREAQLAAERELQMQLAAEREAMARRVEAMERAAAERAAAREAALEALRQENIYLAQRHIAAWRIGRAWRRYRHGAGWAARHAAAVCIQAVWRAVRDRRRAAALRQRRDVLLLLQEAARAGRADELQAIAEKADALGLGDTAQKYSLELERAAGEAAERLRSAASAGTYADFRAASTAVAGFPQLKALLEESTAVFDKRRAEAAASLRAAATDQPMAHFMRLVEAAGSLGLEPQELRSAVESVRKRDAELVARLALAVEGRSPIFDAAAFSQLEELGTRFGLKGDVAAARHALERRRRALSAELSVCKGAAVTGAQLAAMAAEAKRLGMTVEAAVCEQQLEQQKKVLQDRLQRAAKGGDAARLLSLVRRTWRLGLSGDLISAARHTLVEYQGVSGLQLASAADDGTLNSYLVARGVSVRSGLALTSLLSADRALAVRRRRVMSDLADWMWPSIRNAPLKAPADPGSPLVVAAEWGISSPLAVVWRAVGNERPGVPTDATAPCPGLSPLALHQPFKEQQAGRSLRTPPSSQSVQGQALALAPSLVGGPGGAQAGSSAASLAAASSLRPLGITALQLGLSDAICLALCAVQLCMELCNLRGLDRLDGLEAPRNYWGEPLLALTHQRNERDPQPLPRRPQVPADRGMQPEQPPPSQQGDNLLSRLLKPLHQSACYTDALTRPWCIAKELMLSFAAMQSLRDCTSRPGDALQSAPHYASGPSQRLNTAPAAAPSDVSGHARPLTRETVLRNTTHATGAGASPHPESRPDLERITILDLGLERLSSLGGLDRLCPSLRVLHANANELTTLDGLTGLTLLRELSLKNNRLTACMQRSPETRRLGGAGLECSGLPSGTALRQLALDSNCLTGALSGLGGCRGLRSLSLADNRLTELGHELQGCAAVLTRLDLRSNCLSSSSLHASVAPLTSLRHLDISGNRLTSLNGIQGLKVLRSLNACGNLLAELPTPLWLPYLTSLDLSQNKLTTYGSSAASGHGCFLPSLERLLLQENEISRLGQLGPQPRLTSLNLSFNKLPTLTELRTLAGLTGLRQLNISDNPATQLDGTPYLQPLAGHNHAELAPYRAPILSLLPCLHELDHHGVLQEERVRGLLIATAAAPSAVSSVLRAVRTSGDLSGMLVPGGGMAGCAMSSGVSQENMRSSSRCPSGACEGRGSRVTGAWTSRRLTVACRRTTGFNHGAVQSVDLQAMRRLLSFGTLMEPQLPGLVRNNDAAAATTRPDHRRLDPVLTAAATAPGRLLASVDPGVGRHLLDTDQSMPAAAFFDLLELQRCACRAVQELSPPGCSADPRAGPSVDLRSSHLNSVGSEHHALLRQQNSYEVSSACLDAPHLRGLRSLELVQQALSTGRLHTMSHPTGVPIPCLAPGEDMPGAEAGRSKRSGTPIAKALEAELEARWERAEAEAWRGKWEEVKSYLQRPHMDMGMAVKASDGSGDKSAGAAPAGRLPLLCRPSYFLRRMWKDAGSHAVVIQSWWQALRCRRLLVAQREQRRRQEAATLIQAHWRGHQVRKSWNPRVARQQADQQREEATKEEDRRREAAAIKIQACYRGYRVRKQLQAAKAAARALTEEADDEGPLDDDMNTSGDLEQLLHFLQPLEKWFQDDEQPHAAGRPTHALQPAAQAAMPGGPFLNGQQQQAHHNTRDAALLRPVMPDARTAPPGQGGSEGPLGEAPQKRGSAPAAIPFGMAPCTTPGASTSSHLPPLPVSAPDFVGTSAQAQVLPNAGVLSRMMLSERDDNGQLAWGWRSRDPPPPLHVSELAEEGHPDGCGSIRDPPYPAVATANGSVSCARASTPGSAASSASPQSGREQRHLERLRALMAEWGFKDLATAEAYYRRTLRQKQGQTRRKLQDKYRDPAERLHKLQQAVGSQGRQGPTQQPQQQNRPAQQQQQQRQVPQAGHIIGSNGNQLHQPATSASSSSGGGRFGGVGVGSNAGAGDRPLRNLNSADGGSPVRTGDGRGVVLPPLLKRCNSYGDPSSGLKHVEGANNRDGSECNVGLWGTKVGQQSTGPGALAGPRRQHAPLPPHGPMGTNTPSVSSTPQSPLLPPLANNWVHSPAHTPPRSGGSGANSGVRGAQIHGTALLAGGISAGLKRNEGAGAHRAAGLGYRSSR